MNIPASGNHDFGILGTNIRIRKLPLIGLPAIHMKSNQCQVQSRFAGR